ncbi:MAG: FHA domain-containing protein [Gemmatimonas sp.]|nr:FHA domain-containing protein [Gemmatimonas sp.]
MLNLLRKFLRPTLREQLEDGVREALRRYVERQSTPNLRVYVSTDLVPEGVEDAMWAHDESEHLRRFALQWAEDNGVPRVGMRAEVILLDTKKEFAFVKPVGAEPVEARSGAPSAREERPSAGGQAVLEVVSSPSLTAPLRIAGELTVGRKVNGDVFGAGDRYMSGRHARFHIAGSTLFVTDLDSKNRTFLNERPLPPHEQVPAAVGDEIRMGATTFRVAEIGE